jgi:uncharacterized protein YjbI with pentapeptide repeats
VIVKQKIASATRYLAIDGRSTIRDHRNVGKEFIMKNCTLLTAASLLAFVDVAQVQAYDQANHQAVKDGQRICQFCDLSGADFANADLSGAVLTAADFADANLTKVDFTKADLTSASLNRAILKGAVLTGAILVWAELDQVDLTETDLTNANLEKAKCNWGTKFPRGSGWICEGVTVGRK